jgi:hypothetical protein
LTRVRDGTESLMMQDDEATADRPRTGLEGTTRHEPRRFSDETFSARVAASPSKSLDTRNGEGEFHETDAKLEESPETAPDTGYVIETLVSPFHCLYQDALAFHTQSRLARSDSEASRLARAALLLYVSSAESLVHQAAAELGRPELCGMLVDPSRPIPLYEAWRLLPAIAGEPGSHPQPFDPEAPPWPQFAELLALRASWAYPGTASQRRAFYRSDDRDGNYEPLEQHAIPERLRRERSTPRLSWPRTGLPRDPYALRPRHVDTARGVLDAAVVALDRRMGGALTTGQRHRREPVRVVHAPAHAPAT